jgi:hypothetical protein
MGHSCTLWLAGRKACIAGNRPRFSYAKAAFKAKPMALQTINHSKIASWGCEERICDGVLGQIYLVVMKTKHSSVHL